MVKRGFHGNVPMTAQTTFRRKIKLPSDIIDIARKDAHVEPKFVEKPDPSWKVKCILCGEPRVPRALDENGICRSASSCNKFRIENRRHAGG